MRFVSTRGEAAPVTLSQAIRNGAAPDGGLYLPESLPRADLSALSAEMPLAEFAAAMLKPFFSGDPLEGQLHAICQEAFDFPNRDRGIAIPLLFRHGLSPYVGAGRHPADER